MKRAALYARYSSDLQSAKSCDDQLALLRAEAVKRGWTVAAEYRDDAQSGASLHGRAGLAALLDAAEARAFDVVFAEALDRISRDLADTATVQKRLVFADATLWTLSEGETNVMHIGLKGTMNQLFLHELGKKTHRGLRGVVASGRSAGGRCYGYALVPGQAGELAIDEAEAAVVVRMFESYAAGASPYAIAKALNAEGVSGPRGPWSESTIAGDRKSGNGILNNDLYRGVRVWNRHRKKKDPATGRARMFANPESEWVRRDVPALRIVSDELWEAVRTRQGALRGKRGAAKRPVRLFSGLLTCAVCGGGMSITGPNSYGCSNRAQRGTCANARTITEREVTERAIAGLRAGLLSPEAQRNAARAYHAEMAKLQEAASGRTRDLVRDLAELDRRIERGFEAIFSGTAPPGTNERVTAMEADRAAKRAALAAIEAQNVVRLHPGAGGLYAEAVGRLAEILRDGQPEGADLRALLRGIVGRVTLTPRQHGRGYDMHIAGDLAALLQAQTQKPPLGGAGVFSVTNPATHKGMVGAGTRTGHSLMPFSLAA